MTRESVIYAWCLRNKEKILKEKYLVGVLSQEPSSDNARK